MRSFRWSTLCCVTYCLLIFGICPATAQQYTASNHPPASLAPIIKKVMPAVVNVAVKGELPPLYLLPERDRSVPIHPKQLKSRKFEGLGSGVIVDAKKGYILTNSHVVHQAKTITVTLSDSRSIKAKLIGTDPSTDVAVLQIQAPNLHSLPFGNSDDLQIGDFVVAIGNPFGLSFAGNKQTATFGIVSALQRSDLSLEGVENFIQTDAAINPGNSGGALVNTQGQLIGINTGIVSPFRGNVGIGLAIPINMAKNVMRQIIRYGSVQRGLMGIFVQQLTPELAEAFHVKTTEGAVVTQVNPDSPAAKAGLKTGDIIVSINGKPVTAATQVKTIVGLLRVGSQVSLAILRQGRPLTLTTRVADVKKHEESLLQQNPFLFGLALENYDQQSPLRGRTKGVVIVGAMESSPAWRAGLRPGDVIIAANQMPVTQLSDLAQAAKQAHQELLVHVMRGPGAIFLVIK